MLSAVDRFTRRASRVRFRIKKVSDRVRLSVHKSGRHLYAQVIDDARGVTLAYASTLDNGVRRVAKSMCNVEYAKIVGANIGERAKKAGVTEVVFDKGGYRYHGVVKALADAAREHLQF